MEENSLLFSIIVPVYQVENYIEQCIESLLPQCRKNSEIIIIDDGSYDRSGAIADEYAKKHECINVIHQDNQGLSEARNIGIHHAKGEYCIFVDGDDMLCEGAIDSLKKCIADKQHPEVVIHRSKVIDSAGRIKECSYWFDEMQMQNLPTSEAYSNIQKLSGLVLAGCLFSVRTEYIKNNQFYFIKGLFHEDEEWVPKIFLNTDRIAYNNTCFYCYRIDREGSITKKLNIKREFDKLKIIDLLEQELGKAKYSFDIKTIIEERIRCIYFGVICSAWQYRKDKEYAKLMQLIKKKRIILRNSKSMKHKAGYVLTIFMGSRAACLCLWHINKARLLAGWKNN